MHKLRNQDVLLHLLLGIPRQMGSNAANGWIHHQQSSTLSHEVHTILSYVWKPSRGIPNQISLNKSTFGWGIDPDQVRIPWGSTSSARACSAEDGRMNSKNLHSIQSWSAGLAWNKEHPDGIPIPKDKTQARRTFLYKEGLRPTHLPADTPGLDEMLWCLLCITSYSISEDGTIWRKLHHSTTYPYRWPQRGRN